MSDEQDKALPDSAADEQYKHQGIDGLISNPAGAQILAENQERDQELQQLQIEVGLLRNKYNLHDPEDQREALFREQIEDEVYHAQEFAASEEGAAHIRQGIIENWSQGEPTEDSDDLYKDGHKGYLKRNLERDKDR